MLKTRYTPQVVQSIARELVGVRRPDPFNQPTLSDTEDLPKLDDLGLVGLAFSGGGIRSATFNIGILQGLDRLGLLHLVDYLSTVSGGGYAGSWYLACLREGKDRAELRDGTLDHLRKFSQYLAPAAGFFSVDTWTIIAIWLRNTLLLQSMLALLFAVLVLSPRLFENVFLFGNVWTLRAAAVLLFVASVGYIARALRELRPDEYAPGERTRWVEQPSTVQGVAVAAMSGSGCFAASLWRPIVHAPPYLLWEVWAGSALVFVASWVTAYSCLAWKERTAKSILGTGAVGFCSGLLAFVLNGLLAALFMRLGSDQLGSGHEGPWIAGMIGAPAVLVVQSLAVVLQIGLLGRAMSDAHREWWSRFGALLIIYSAGPFALFFLAVFGPYFVTWLLSAETQNWITQTFARTVTLGGMLTTIGGVYAAWSANTPNGDSRLKTWLATVAPYIFIVGILLIVATAVDRLLQDLVGAGGPVGLNTYWPTMGRSITTGRYWLVGLLFGVFPGILLLFVWRVDINETSMNPFYRNRLVRCFEGAARDDRHPHGFTSFDYEDDFSLGELRPDLEATGGHQIYKGPVPIVNTAVNRAGGEDATAQERRAGSFFFTPYDCGSDYTATVDTKLTSKYPRGIRLGACVATSGAAASPNMGYHTSAPIAFLLTFFNVRLGLWIRHPRKLGEGARSGESGDARKFQSRWGFYYLLKELLASASVDDNYIYLSDGGHFENLGVYELVRRRCRYIIVGDGEQDGKMVMDGLGSLVRKCRIDFNVEIKIDTSEIRTLDAGWRSHAHCAVGRIWYPGTTSDPGYLIYLKASMTGDEPSDVTQYKAEHEAFPHEPTSDQFFSESQFESYRALGQHVVENAFHSMKSAGATRPIDRSELGSIMADMEQAWPASSPSAARNRDSEVSGSAS